MDTLFSSFGDESQSFAQSPTFKSLLRTKSVLRYPGGKSRAVSAIVSYVPPNTREMASPFLGGGSVELACNDLGIKVFGSDAFKPLINFWSYLLEAPSLLAKEVENYYPLRKESFYKLQKEYGLLPDSFDQAAAFFVLNRSSFSGTTLSGGMSPGHPRFTSSAIERLRAFSAPLVSVESCDYKQAMAKHEDKLLYLDPPYANGGKLYGTRGDMHDGFDHLELARLLSKRDAWILSYNDCSLVRDLYSSYKIVELNWLYGMSKNKSSKELLIINV